MRGRIAIMIILILMLISSGCVLKHKEGYNLKDIAVLHVDLPQTKLSTNYGETSCKTALVGDVFDVVWGFEEFIWPINISLSYSKYIEEKDGILLTRYATFQESEKEGNETQTIEHVEGVLHWEGKKLFGKKISRATFKVLSSHQSSFFVLSHNPYEEQYPEWYEHHRYPTVYFGRTNKDALQKCYEDFCRNYVLFDYCSNTKKCSKEEASGLIDKCRKKKYEVIES